MIDQQNHPFAPLPSDPLRGTDQSWVRPSAAFGVRTRRGALLIVIAALVVFVATLPLDPFQTYGAPTGLAGHARSPQNSQERAPAIIVAPMIYAEPSEALPVLIEIDPPQWVPLDGALHVRGLPPTATLSAGYRVSADVWAVPLSGLANLEIRVAAGISEQSNLDLALVRASGELMAEVRTVLSVLEPIGTIGAVANARGATADETGRTARGAGSHNIEGPPAPSEMPEAVPSSVAASRIAAAAPEPAQVSPSNSSGQPSVGNPARETNSASSALPDPLPKREIEASAQPAAAMVSRVLETSPEAPPPAPMEPPLSGAKAIATAALEAPRATANSIAPEAPRAAAKAITQEQRSLAEKLIARGERHLDNGNVSEARQFFRHAADAGLAQGALLLASTYDPHEFAKLRFVGVQPNIAIARKWYDRARELGAGEARDRLARLGAVD